MTIVKNGFINLCLFEFGCKELLLLGSNSLGSYTLERSLARIKPMSPFLINWYRFINRTYLLTELDDVRKMKYF